MSSGEKLSRKEFLLQFLRDPERKSLPRIAYEMTVLMFKYRELPVHYFSRYLFKKDIKNYKDYLPNNFFDTRIKPVFNDKSLKEVLDNKLYFDMFFNKVGVNVPEIIMFNNRNVFIHNGNNSVIDTFGKFRSLLGDIFNIHSVDSIFIKKTGSSSGGSNIHKLTYEDLNNGSTLIEGIYQEIIHSEYLFQKTIRQHSELNKLSPSSLNTIRIDTFIDKSGQVDVMSAYLRMSITNTHVDNISLGGCYVGIDMDNGILYKKGYSSIDTLGVKVLSEHPLTGIVFEGFEIPDFDAVKELAKKAASFMPGLRMIGWDVAVKEDGPVHIEGNYDYEIRGNDFVSGGYLRNPVFRKALMEIDYI